MGTAGAKLVGDMLLVNKTIQTLDVSDNGFGKMQVGEQVKLKSGKMGKVTSAFDNGDLQVGGGVTIVPSDVQFDAYGIPAFCAGVAASPSLISVSTAFRHALAVSISHSSPLSYHVRSSMLNRMVSEPPAPRLLERC